MNTKESIFRLISQKESTMRLLIHLRDRYRIKGQNNSVKWSERQIQEKVMDIIKLRRILKSINKNNPEKVVFT